MVLSILRESGDGEVRRSRWKMKTSIVQSDTRISDVLQEFAKHRLSFFIWPNVGYKLVEHLTAAASIFHTRRR